MWVRRGKAADATRSDTDRIAELAADSGEPVGEVLREVADFRLALETDLLIAAAAADIGESDLLSDVVDGERAQLATFQDRLLDKLAEAESVRLMRHTSRGVVRTRIVGVAAAVLALVGGGLVTQQVVGTPVQTVNAALAEADKELKILSGTIELAAPNDAVLEAADELHETIETLIAEHGDDPQYAERIAELIVREHAMLLKQAPGAHPLLGEIGRLAQRLVPKAPAKVRKALVTVATVPAPAPTKPPERKESPKPAATSQKPSPKPSSSSPKPSSSASPSPSQSGVLPPAP